MTTLGSDVDLSHSHNRNYDPGKPFWYRTLWLVVEALTLLNPLFVPYRLKARILRRFGATIGQGLVIKPGVHIKYPWQLTLGDHVWLGERAWIDNFVPVTIASNVCISQGAYLCTGNHDWTDPAMPLMVAPITIEEGAWIGAHAKVAPGVTIAQNSIVTLGSVLLKNTEPNGIYRGNPATRIATRHLNDKAQKAPSLSQDWEREGVGGE